MPQSQHHHYSQAIMDLGATICHRAMPLCSHCPMALICHANVNNKTEALPEKKPRKKQKSKTVYFMLVRDNNDRILTVRRPKSGLWASMWSLPEIENDEPNTIETLYKQYGIDRSIVQSIKKLPRLLIF